MSTDLTMIQLLAERITGQAQALHREVRRLNAAVHVEPSMEALVESSRRLLLEHDGKPPAQVEAELLARYGLPEDDEGLIGFVRMVKAGKTDADVAESLALLLCVLPPERCRVLAREFPEDILDAAGRIARGDTVTVAAAKALRRAARVYDEEVRRDAADLAVMRVLAAVGDPAMKERVLARLAADHGEWGRRIADTATRPPTPAEVLARLPETEMRAVLMRLPPETLARFLAVSPPETRERVCAFVDPRAADWLRGSAEASADLPTAEADAARQTVASAIADAVARGEISWPTGMPLLDGIPVAAPPPKARLHVIARSDGSPAESAIETPEMDTLAVPEGAGPIEADADKAEDAPPTTSDESVAATPNRTTERIVGAVFLALAAAGYAAGMTGDSRFAALSPIPEFGLATCVALSATALASVEDSLTNLLAKLACGVVHPVAMIGIAVLTMTWGSADAAPWTGFMAITLLAASAGNHDGWIEVAGSGLVFTAVAMAGWYPPWAVTAVHVVAVVFAALSLGANAHEMVKFLRGRRSVRDIHQAVLRLTDAEVRSLLRHVTVDSVATLIAAAPPRVAERLYDNMSERAVAIMREDVQRRGNPTPDALAEAAEVFRNGLAECLAKGEIERDPRTGMPGRDEVKT